MKHFLLVCRRILYPLSILIIFFGIVTLIFPQPIISFLNWWGVKKTPSTGLFMIDAFQSMAGDIFGGLATRLFSLVIILFGVVVRSISIIFAIAAKRYNK